MPKTVDNLLEFLGSSPTPLHAVSNITKRLDQAGFRSLRETEIWSENGSELEPGKYYVTRNDSSLIAFQLSGSPQDSGFRLVGAHTDSPCLKVKPNAISCNNGYAKLGVEVYGGVLLNPWFDRDLGLAGRVTVETKKGEIKNLLINVARPIAFIPSLAIHLDREVNENRSINKQKHLPPVLCRTDDSTLDFHAMVCQWIKAQHPESDKVKVLSYELSLYDYQAPGLVGINQEFIASARLDNLLSCHAGNCVSI